MYCPIVLAMLLLFLVRWSGKQLEKGGEDTYPAPHENYSNTPHTAEKRLKLAKKYARAYTASFCHQWGILKLL